MVTNPKKRQKHLSSERKTKKKKKIVLPSPSQSETETSSEESDYEDELQPMRNLPSEKTIIFSEELKHDSLKKLYSKINKLIRDYENKDNIESSNHATLPMLLALPTAALQLKKYTTQRSSFSIKINYGPEISTKWIVQLHNSKKVNKIKKKSPYSVEQAGYDISNFPKMGLMLLYATFLTEKTIENRILQIEKTGVELVESFNSVEQEIIFEKQVERLLINMGDFLKVSVDMEWQKISRYVLLGLAILNSIKIENSDEHSKEKNASDIVTTITKSEAMNNAIEAINDIINNTSEKSFKTRHSINRIRRFLKNEIHISIVLVSFVASFGPIILISESDQDLLKSLNMSSLEKLESEKYKIETSLLGQRLNALNVEYKSAILSAVIIIAKHINIYNKTLETQLISLFNAHNPYLKAQDEISIDSNQKSSNEHKEAEQRKQELAQKEKARKQEHELEQQEIERKKHQQELAKKQHQQELAKKQQQQLIAQQEIARQQHEKELAQQEIARQQQEKQNKIAQEYKQSQELLVQKDIQKQANEAEKQKQTELKKRGIPTLEELKTKKTRADPIKRRERRSNEEKVVNSVNTNQDRINRIASIKERIEKTPRVSNEDPNYTDYVNFINSLEKEIEDLENLDVISMEL